MKCSWCGALLSDVDGVPRFDLFTATVPGSRTAGKLAFVCYGGCHQSRPRTHVARASTVRDRALATLGGRRG